MTFVKFASGRPAETSFSKRFSYGFTGNENGFNPNVDVFVDEKEFHLNAELPGVKKEDLSLKLENNILTIKGKKTSGASKEAKVLINERNYGEFERTFKFAENVNPDSVNAKLENGILNITVARMTIEQAKERIININ